MDNRIITQLRACIDSLKGRVLFVGATNSLETLDLALRSRFYEVAIKIPNENARKKNQIKMGCQSSHNFSHIL
jgi:AAA+ superfamily predicted ATPase